MFAVLGSSPPRSAININNHSWTGSPRPLDCLPFFQCSRYPNSVLDCIEILVEHGLMNFALSNDKGDAESIIFRLVLLFYEKYTVLCYNEWKCRLLLIRINKIINLLLSLGLGSGPAKFESDRGLKFEKECLNLSDDARSCYRLCEGGKIDFSRHVNLDEYLIFLPLLKKLVGPVLRRFDQSPLRLSELARNAIRISLGGQQFLKNANSLPLPTELKECGRDGLSTRDPPQASLSARVL